jgi:RHS repeat-associated protein
VTGQKLATYNLVTQGQTTQFVMIGQNAYFGGKLVAKGVPNSPWTLTAVASDRLGSIGKFYPYGQEINPTSDLTEKFTGYFRDAGTGLDYADQRYYEYSLGRFTSPDPYRSNGSVSDPQVLNRYAYVGGDPINRKDPSGLFWCDPEDPFDCNPCDLDPTLCVIFVFPIDYLTPVSKQERATYEKAIQALLAAAWAAGASDDQAGASYPKYLKVASDTYTCFGKAVERDVSYQLYGSDDQPLNTGTVTEHLFPIDYHAPIITRPQINQSSGLPNGRFDDTISVQFGPTRNYLQTFTVRDSSLGLVGFTNIPVYVVGFGAEYGILAVYKTFNYVDINGNKGPVRKCQ